MPTPAPLLAALLAAQAAATPPTPNTRLNEVTVVGSRDVPHLVRTFPAAGSTPDFGVVILTVAFDEPMRAGSGPPVAGAGAPDCRPTWRLLNDGKTFIALCALKSGEAAHMRLEGFRSAAGGLAAPVELAFTADADKIDPAVEDALKSAGLRPEDGPVMDWAPSAPVAASATTAPAAPAG